MSHLVLATRFGKVTLSWNGDKPEGIHMSPFAPRSEGEAVLVEGEPPGGEGTKLFRELRAYFEGTLKTFSVRLDTDRYTPFHREVWAFTREIPYGETRAYGEIARALGRPNGARAVGGAMAHNPFPIVIPCHRVLGANGALTGFGPGLAWKQALLEWEGALNVLPVLPFERLKST